MTIPRLDTLSLGGRSWRASSQRYGWTIKSTATHDIDVCPMLFDHRIVMTAHGNTGCWDHGWCYSSRNGPLDAVVAALAWDPDTQAEPADFTARACHCLRVLPNAGP